MQGWVSILQEGDIYKLADLLQLPDEIRADALRLPDVDRDLQWTWKSGRINEVAGSTGILDQTVVGRLAQLDEKSYRNN